MWVGAWWLGFLLSGALAILTAIPMLAFPKYLPGTAEIRANRVSEAYAGGKDSVGAGAGAGAGGEDEKEVKGFGALWRSVKRLVTNPTFIFLNLAGASEGRSLFLIYLIFILFVYLFIYFRSHLFYVTWKEELSVF